MALREDEKFVRDCLVKYFDIEKTEAWEGEDPPDIYIKVKGETIAVEITRLSWISFDQDGSIQNRNTQDSFGSNLCHELDSKLGGYVPPEIDIILTMYVPVKNVKKYKNELYNYLKDLITQNLKAGNRKEIVIADERVNISIVPNEEQSHKGIVGIIVNKNSDPFILRNAEVILADRLREKQEKCKKIQHKGPIWLVFFNDYWLADYRTYSQAFKNIALEHDFDRIYIILDNGEVRQLFKLLPGKIITETAFEEQFRKLFKSDDASKAINVVYIWRTEKPIPRLRGESDIIYIGKTKNSLEQRHARYASVEGSGLNLKRYEFILKTYGPIWVEYQDYPEKRDVHKMEQELLAEYFKRHLEYPPLNRLAR
jgi:hypothetical protein